MNERKGYRSARIPETEAEELVLYKNLFQLQVVGSRRKDAEAILAEADAAAQKLVDEVKPFASWEEIGIALGIPGTVASNRYNRRDRATDGK